MAIGDGCGILGQVRRSEYMRPIEVMSAEADAALREAIAIAAEVRLVRAADGAVLPDAKGLWYSGTGLGTGPGYTRIPSRFGARHKAKPGGGGLLATKTGRGGKAK